MCGWQAGGNSLCQAKWNCHCQGFPPYSCRSCCCCSFSPFRHFSFFFWQRCKGKLRVAYLNLWLCRYAVCPHCLGGRRKSDSGPNLIQIYVQHIFALFSSIPFRTIERAIHHRHSLIKKANWVVNICCPWTPDEGQGDAMDPLKTSSLFYLPSL